jgi:hypothetical protein
MATDLTKQPLEILVDLINATNGCALTEDDIFFGPPVALSNSNRNTAMRITAKPNSLYDGSRDVTYDRIDMATIPGPRSATFHLDGARTVSDLVPKLNVTYQLNLQPEDYYDDILPDLSQMVENNYHFVVRAKPGSYIYRNWIVLSGLGDRIILGNEITQNLLNGFIMPDMAETLEGEALLNGFFFPGEITPAVE